jgi:hypothetical protein
MIPAQTVAPEPATTPVKPTKFSSLATLVTAVAVEKQGMAWDEVWDEAVTQNVPFVTLDQIDGQDPPALLLDRLDPLEGTILYGPGGVGKGSLASWWIARLVLSGKRVLILDYEGHGGEWRRRVQGLVGVAPLADVLYVAPLRDGLGSLAKAAPHIRSVVATQGIGYVVIDSAVMAVGMADALKPEAAVAYAEGLQLLGVPSLTLAHVTKVDGDSKYPFGSVFWHNLARLTWSMERKGDEVLLVNRKANNYARQPSYAVELDYHNGRLASVTERQASETLMEKVASVLADGPLSVADIAASINADQSEPTKPNAIRSVLSRELRSGPTSRVTKAGEVWGLRE